MRASSLFCVAWPFSTPSKHAGDSRDESQLSKFAELSMRCVAHVTEPCLVCPSKTHSETRHRHCVFTVEMHGRGWEEVRKEAFARFHSRNYWLLTVSLLKRRRKFHSRHLYGSRASIPTGSIRASPILASLWRPLAVTCLAAYATGRGQ